MKLIILDRDGVINYDSGDYIKSPEEWRAIPGSLEAIARLTLNDYRIIVVTNQPGLACGKFQIENLNAIHKKMLNYLSQFGGVIDAIFFCPHGPDDGCDCRKPQPGLFYEIIRRLRVPLNGVISVGDKLTDIEASQAAGATPVLVKTGCGQSVVDGGKLPQDVQVYSDLAAVADELLSRH